MREADWWLCDRCKSLNNLSARKCYSCRQRKSKQAVRLSEHLGLVPVVDRNGKLSLKPAEVPAPVQPAQAKGELPPLRDPVIRHILAVAPQPPQGARITYRVAEGSPHPLPPPPPQPAYRPPAQTGPVPVVAVGPGPPAAVAGLPAVVPAPDDVDPTQRWPHWQELLDGPKPEAERLRIAHRSDDDAAATSAGATAGDGPTLGEAIEVAQGQRDAGAERFIPWPEADRHKGQPPQADRDELKPRMDVTARAQRSQPSSAATGDGQATAEANVPQSGNRADLPAAGPRDP